MISLITIIAAVGLLLLIASLLRRPQRGVLLLAALVPFDGLLLLIDDLPPIVKGWKEALVLLVLAGTFVAPPDARDPVVGRPIPDWFLPVAGLGVVSLASAFAVGGVQGLIGLKIWLFYVLVFWALRRCPFTLRDRDHLVTVLMAAGVLTSAVGLVQQAVGPAILNALGYDYNTAIRTSGGLLRSFSTFEQPFPFGLFLTLVLLVGLPVALSDARRPRNVAFFASCPVLLAGIASSNVRSAMLGLGVGLAFLAAHRYTTLAHLIAPAVIGLLFIPWSMYETVVSPQSLFDRIGGWAQMASVVISSPFGIGIGATGAAAEKTIEFGGSTEGILFAPGWNSGYQPDNQYVKTVLEFGPVGLWLLVLLLLATFLTARRVSLLCHGSDAAMAAGIAASFLCIIMASFVATYFEIFPLDVYFWLMLGVLASLSPQQPTSAAGLTAVTNSVARP